MFLSTSVYLLWFYFLSPSQTKILYEFFFFLTVEFCQFSSYSRSLRSVFTQHHVQNTLRYM